MNERDLVTLKVLIDGNMYSVSVAREVIDEGESFFSKMDQDMNKGWMMSREWVENPTKTQRCQIAADRIVDSIHSENETLTHLMVGYILTRLENVKEVHIDTDGNMMETEFITT